MPVAYSYLRFSTPEQAEGNSTRRQIELSARWATRNDFTLDDTLRLRDEGRSGFHGRHIKSRKGALGQFLNFIRAGVVKPGSALILENLDRLSRQNIKLAMDTAREILEAGVDIVTVVPEHRYSKEGLEKNAVEWILLTTEFQRAHDESVRKSDLAKDNWTEKRKALAEGKTVTAVRSFWLDILQDGEPVPEGRGKLDLTRPVQYRLNDQADTVRLVFRLADEGYGSLRISKELLARGLRFRRAEIVTIANVIRLLRNREVLGEYQPRYARDEKGIRHEAGEVVEDYFPKLIAPDLFYRVQEKISQRKKTGRGRKGGLVNLFTSLVLDARDNGKMRVRGSRGVPYMMNYLAMKGSPGSVWIDFPYYTFEKAVLGACRELSPAFLMPETSASEKLQQLEGELKDIGQKLQRAKGRLDKATDEAEEEVYSSQVVRLTRRRKELETELDRTRAEVSSQPSDQLQRLQSLIDLMEQAEDKTHTRTIVAGLIASLVHRVYIYVQRRGKRTRYEKRAWVWVVFKNGRWRKLFVQADGTTVSVPGEGVEELTPEMLSVDGSDGWE